MKTNKIVIYNLYDVEILLIETTLSRETVIQKAIEFKKNGGHYESDFVDQLNQEGFAEIIAIETVDFNYLEEYENE